MTHNQTYIISTRRTQKSFVQLPPIRQSACTHTCSGCSGADEHVTSWHSVSLRGFNYPRNTAR